MKKYTVVNRPAKDHVTGKMVQPGGVLHVPADWHDRYAAAGVLGSQVGEKKIEKAVVEPKVEKAVIPKPQKKPGFTIKDSEDRLYTSAEVAAMDEDAIDAAFTKNTIVVALARAGVDVEKRDLKPVQIEKLMAYVGGVE